MSDQNQQDGGLNIELTEEMASGVYCNLAIITHSQTEFILDFVQMMPGVPKAKVQSRVLLHPLHAKRLLMALNENVNRFEDQFGEIELEEPGFPLNLGGPTAQA